MPPGVLHRTQWKCMVSICREPQVTMSLVTMVLVIFLSMLASDVTAVTLWDYMVIPHTQNQVTICSQITSHQVIMDYMCSVTHYR